MAAAVDSSPSQLCAAAEQALLLSDFSNAEAHARRCLASSSMPAAVQERALIVVLQALFEQDRCGGEPCCFETGRGRAAAWLERGTAAAYNHTHIVEQTAELAASGPSPCPTLARAFCCRASAARQLLSDCYPRLEDVPPNALLLWLALAVSLQVVPAARSDQQAELL